MEGGEVGQIGETCGRRGNSNWMKGEGRWHQEALLSQDKEDSDDDCLGKARSKKLSLLREA